MTLEDALFKLCIVVNLWAFLHAFATLQQVGRHRDR